MSRYDIEFDAANRFLCTVGYDPGLETYFAQVRDRSIDEDASPPRDPIVFWAGTLVGELPSVERLQETIKPFVGLDPEMAAALRADERREWHPPTVLQQMVRDSMMQSTPRELPSKRNRKFMEEIGGAAGLTERDGVLTP